MTRSEARGWPAFGSRSGTVLAEQDAENGSAAQLVMVDDEIPHSSAPVKASAHHLSFKQLDDWGKLIRRKVEKGQLKACHCPAGWSAVEAWPVVSGEGGGNGPSTSGSNALR